MEHRIHLVCGCVVVFVSLFCSFDLLIWHLCVIPINILNYCNTASSLFSSLLTGIQYCYLNNFFGQAMSDFSQLLFMWFVCHHKPVIKGFVISCLSSMLKILTNASNNNYATDLLTFLL